MTDEMLQSQIAQSGEEVDLLVAEDEYLTSGVHIGTQHKTADMKPHIFRVRNDGLFVLNVANTDAGIRAAAKMLAPYDAARILFVSQRQYGQTPAKETAKAVGATAIAGRFMPGTLTNPVTPNFMEPEVLVVTDPLGDAQAMREARNIGIPILGFCDSNNETKGLDLAVPANNKGRRSLALVYWLLAREILMEKNQLANRDAFTLSVEDFEASL